MTHPLSYLFNPLVKQAERARDELERELEDLQDQLEEQGGATQAQVRISFHPIKQSQV